MNGYKTPQGGHRKNRRLFRKRYSRSGLLPRCDDREIHHRFSESEIVERRG